MESYRRNAPEEMGKNSGKITLNVKWARGILKSLDWSKRRGTTAKREMNPSLYDELPLSWKKEIADLILRHKVSEELVLNLDQTPLELTSASNVTFAPHGAKKVPISNIDDTRMITGTFCVSMKGDFLSIQLIYAGKTNRCHPKIKFRKGFHVTHTPNHWSNEKVHIEYLKKTVFPYVENVRKVMNLGEDQKALLIYDVFKGQTKGAVTKSLESIHCLSKKVPENHTNLFQPLELTVNKPAQSFVSNKYQDWYADCVSEQLNRGVASHDVKVGVKLSTVKPLHTQWVVDFYNNMQLASSKSIIKKGFKKALIRDAFNQAEALANCSDNPFIEMDIELS